MTYHVRGFMAFTTNELGFGPDRGIVCQNEAISDTRVSLGAFPLGWRGTPQRPIFVSSHEKCLFLFWNIEIGFLVRQLSKSKIERWAQHPT
jgi:hypothetical protein